MIDLDLWNAFCEVSPSGSFLSTLQRQKKVCTPGDEAIMKIHKKLFSGIPINCTFLVISSKPQRIWSWNFGFATRKIWAFIWYQKMYYFRLSPGGWECDRHKVFKTPKLALILLCRGAVLASADNFSKSPLIWLHPRRGPKIIPESKSPPHQKFCEKTRGWGPTEWNLMKSRSSVKFMRIFEKKWNMLWLTGIFLCIWIEGFLNFFLARRYHW